MPLIFIFGMLGVSTDSLGYIAHSTLDKNDFLLMETDHIKGPALWRGSYDRPYWESYNEWLCFPSHDLRLSLFEIEYEHRAKLLPQIDVWRQGYLYEITLNAGSDLDSGQVIDIWVALTYGVSEVCVYAAFLQEIEVDGGQGGLWVISRLKTSRGTWVEPR